MPSIVAEGNLKARGDILVLAAGAGDLATVNNLLGVGTDVDSRCPPPLGKFNAGKAEVVEERGLYLRVLHNGETCDRLRRDLARTALQAAAEGGHQELLEVLLKAGADVNAPPAEYYGRTALQAAAEGGHEAAVKFLIDAGADVNAPPAKSYGRTALQAAAEGGHEAVVKFLIDAGANVNAPPAERSGTTALQAAAGGGHEAVVKFLIDAGADVNAPPAEYYGRTALQAAADGGHEAAVKFLIDAGADVNAPPAEEFGRTALQAAAEGGHEAVVKFLIDAKANVNAPPAKSYGITALEGGLSSRNTRVLEILSSAPINIHEKNTLGRTILHRACESWNEHELGALLSLSIFDINAKDYFGSTPLHIVIGQKKEALVKVLMNESPDMDIKDDSGVTPLQLALDEKLQDIMHLLLRKGASTDGLRVDKLHSLLDNSDHPNAVIRCERRSESTSVNVHTGDSEINNLLDKEWTSLSMYFVVPKFGVGNSGGTGSFVNPHMYLNSYRFRGHDRNHTMVQWAYLVVSDDFMPYETPGFEGIPTSQKVLSSEPAKVILIAYQCFNALVHEPERGSAQDSSGDTAITQFQLMSREIEISWIMRDLDEYRNQAVIPLLRSMHFRGTLKLKYLSIPQHGVEYFIWLLNDVHQTWLELVEEAKLHLAQIRDVQLKKAGQDPKVIECLLGDSQQWNKLHACLQDHLSKSRSLLNDFKTHDVLYKELVNFENSKGNTAIPETVEKGRENPENLEAIKALSEKIRVFEADCGKAISDLQKETKEMVGLEFNLVSIFEARRSIEMSTISNSMSMSMKRLSWITFVFLPLSFVSGLFGMNVNLLANDPSWVWYIAFAVPVVGLIILIWSLTKNNNIGSPMGPAIGSKDDEKPTPEVTSQQISFIARFTSWLQRGREDRQRDEVNQAVPPISAEAATQEKDKVPSRKKPLTPATQRNSEPPPKQVLFMAPVSWLRRRQKGRRNDEENQVIPQTSTEAPTRRKSL